VQESGGLRQLRSALDDDDSDPVSCIERDQFATSAPLYLPPVFVPSAARRGGARTSGEGEDVTGGLGGCRQQPTCFARWWTQVCRRRRDVARHRHDNDDDDCWRLFPSKHRSRAMSHDTGRRSAAEPGVASLCSSPAAAEDAVDVPVRRTSHGGEVALLSRSCRLAAADSDKSALEDGRRHRCTRVMCVILGGLCVAVVGLLVGGLVIASPAGLHYSE